MPHYGTISVRDSSAELSRTAVNFGAVTAVSIAGLLTQWGTLKTAIDGIILGVIASESLVMDATVLSNAMPADENAHRELKWLVTYQGDTSLKKFRLEIPTPDATLRVPGSDDVLLTQPAIAAFVAAFEDVARSPDNDTETVTVLSIKMVGRNN